MNWKTSMVVNHYIATEKIYFWTLRILKSIENNSLQVRFRNTWRTCGICHMISVLNLWKSFLLNTNHSQIHTNSLTYTTANIINVPVLTVCLFTDVYVVNSSRRKIPGILLSFLLHVLLKRRFGEALELLWAGTGFKCSIHWFITSLLIHKLRPGHTKDENDN